MIDGRLKTAREIPKQAFNLKEFENSDEIEQFFPRQLSAFQPEQFLYCREIRHPPSTIERQVRPTNACRKVACNLWQLC
jgi:hypothetical protein